MGFTRNWFQVAPFYGWCAAAAGLGLFLALLPHGGARGLYCDDYTFKRTVLDLTTGEWKPKLIVDPYFRPLAQTLTANFAAAIPDREVPVRVLWALVHFTNATLVGLLTWRILPSPLAAVFSLLLFLVPVPAHESLLWHAAFCGAG